MVAGHEEFLVFDRFPIRCYKAITLPQWQVTSETEMCIVGISADDKRFDVSLNSQLERDEDACDFGILGGLRTQLEFLGFVWCVFNPYAVC